MDFTSFLGLIMFIGAIVFGVIGLDREGNPLDFWTGEGISIVIGGTFSAVILRSTAAEFFNMFPTMMKIFRHKIDKPVDLIDQMVELATIARKDGMIALEGQEINNRMLAKGVRALVDGNDAAFIRSTLQRDTAITAQRHESARSVLQSLGDTAPAMGMIGTLIGLVKLLKDLETNPGGIGQAMSIALLTTFYGAVMANGIFLPMAQKLENHSKKEELNNEMIIEGVIFIQKGGNPRLLDDLLSSFLSPKINRKRAAAQGA